MSWLDEQRGYDRARGDFTGVINNIEWVNWVQARQTRSVIQQLQARAEAANAVSLDIQSRLQASEECVRFLDRANADLCAELLDLSSRLQEWTEYGEKSQATIAQQKTEIARLTAALEKAQLNIKNLIIDSPF